MDVQQIVPEEYRNRITKELDWRQVVSRIQELPSMPENVSVILRLIDEPTTNVTQLTQAFGKDASLVTRVLKMANSAMFARAKKVETLQQAFTVIGLKPLKSLVMAASLMQFRKRPSKFVSLIWDNSVSTAIGAGLIAKKLRRNFVDEAFLLGLLHNFGQIALVSDAPEEYRQVLDLIERDHVDYLTAEQTIWGFSHTLIGALLSKKWNFSPDISHVILSFKDQLDEDGPAMVLDEKIAIVQLADILSHRAGIGNPTGYPDEEQRMLEAAVYMGMKGEGLKRELDELTEAIKHQFNIDNGLYH